MGADRFELGEDHVDPAAEPRSAPAQGLGELAASDPEETGHLGVELASITPRRAADRTERRQCHSNRVDHGAIVGPADQRAVFER
jgi:hypothetical protein